MKDPSVKGKSQVKQLRIGVYSGTFDPVHAGHVAFALQALRTAGLDAVYFLPERNPRYKPHVEHFGHRVAMLDRALKPYARLKVLDDFPEKHFTVSRTLPRLRQRFSGSVFVFLLGSDVLEYMRKWEGIESLLMRSELVVGLRSGVDTKYAQQMIEDLPLSPQSYIIKAAEPEIASSRIRDDIHSSARPPGLLTSVYNYVKREWLYLKNPS